MAKQSFPRLQAAEEIAGLWNQSSDLQLVGVQGAALGKLLADLVPHLTGPLLVVVGEPEEMEDVVGDAALFGAGANVHAFPAWDILPSETGTPDLDIGADRVGALKALRQSDVPTVLVTPISALLQPAIHPNALEQGHLSIVPGTEIAPEAVAARLVDAGLESVAQVDGPGQFCRRGGILDVFPSFAGKPIRIEWFGDEIDTIRHFDLATQRSEAARDEEVVLIEVSQDCFRKACESKTKVGLADHLPPESQVMLHHPQRLSHISELYESGFEPSSTPLLSFQEVAALLAKHTLTSLPELEGEEWDTALWREGNNPVLLKLQTQSLERMTGSLEVTLDELRLLEHKKTRITIFCNNAAERTRLHELLLEKGKGIAHHVELLIGHLSKGFLLGQSTWAVLADHEIFGRQTLRRTTRKRFQGAPIASFTDLRPGDYVVHVVNGIARYEGIETLESNDTKQDYLTLRFAEDARLYVPLSHVDLVQRYVGSGDARPPLSKLGGAAWARKKKAAEKAARDVAAELLRLQAVRKAMPGIAYDVDDELMMEFEAAFPYEETPDQYAAISDIKGDQERAYPMDRLLCGDVGFGKTEVAIRAAFKVVNSGKQVAILVPTTILAEQHLRTFKERLADYPVMVGCLNRFRTSAEQKRIVEDLQEGRLDIVIGTHRILSQDVCFKDLGLAVIDEEQRFGVEHKERLKAMRASVDVLTMTATPIPRTLNMALLGLRDISNLTTAPTERQTIRTNVIRYSEEVIRRAMLRELSRGGQCFFLHNRVHNIDSMAAELAALVPEARFGIAHGQMPEKQLLDVMNRFLDGKIDVLVCTTIIESGVDIPNVNTLFVNEADHFGLSELHQLRGRVGRYRYQAYAYFLVPQKRPITPIAQKRLRALEEYSELGAGFRIAMRDLEIRGAGNVLGVQQSGHICAIGFDLYCRLLEKCVAEYRGEEVEEGEPVELDLGTIAYVPTEYIDADRLRIDFYRKLSNIHDDKGMETMQRYSRQRFGPTPEPVLRLYEDQRIRNQAANLGVKFLGRTDGGLVIAFTESGAHKGVARLRTLGRKVTPMEGARWRIGLEENEVTLEHHLEIISQTLQRLSISSNELKAFEKDRKTKDTGPAAWSSGIKVNKPKLGKIEVGGPPPRKTRTQAQLDMVSSQIESEPPKEEKRGGAAVLGIEPNERLGILNLMLKQESFDMRQFGSVTLVMTPKTRFFLRYTGTAKAPQGQVGLTVRAETPEQVREIVEAHLASGGSELLEGVVE